MLPDIGKGFSRDSKLLSDLKLVSFERLISLCDMQGPRAARLSCIKSISSIGYDGGNRQFLSIIAFRAVAQTFLSER